MTIMLYESSFYADVFGFPSVVNTNLNTSIIGIKETLFRFDFALVDNLGRRR